MTYINTIYTKETFTIDAFRAHKTIELVYVISGQLDMEYYPQSGKAIQNVSLFDNQLMIIQPGVYHFQKIKDKAHIMVLEFLYEDGTMSILDFLAYNEFIKMIPNAQDFLKKLSPVTIITDSYNIQDNFQKLIRLLYNQHKDQGNEFFEVDYTLYLMRLTLNIFKSHHANTTKRYNKYTEFVYSYLQKNYALPFSLKKLEEATNLSKTYLNSLFKKDIGQSIYAYLTSLRINKAVELLNEQTMSISAVAKKVGFNNLRSFEIAFAKILHTPPTEYVSKLKKKNVGLWVDHETRVTYDNEEPNENNY